MQSPKSIMILSRYGIGAVIVYGSRQLLSKLPDFQLTLLGKKLIPTQTVKDLGVTFDRNLNFNEHILKTVSSCMSGLDQISRVKYVLKKELLVTVINSLVFSKLYYCSVVWSNTTDRNIRKLQGIQNFTARIISGTRKYDHITPVLKELQWIPVKLQLYYLVAIMAFKCMTGTAPSYLSSQFVSRGSVSGRVTRQSTQLNIPLLKTASGHRTFYFRIVKLWNDLCPKLKLSMTIRDFKRKLKMLLFEQFLLECM